jgi:tRNA A-37 threonylcarbamoyl transferase component Bud32
MAQTSKKFIKIGHLNRAIFDGTWQEFCENLIKFDIPSQQKAHRAGLAPNAYQVTFDHYNKTYSLSMDLIDGETLLNYINDRVLTITIDDKIIDKIGNLYKLLFNCLHAHHPDWAARNIMVEFKDPNKYWIIDFEAFYIDDDDNNRIMDEEDYIIAMRYFCSDLSQSFSGELKQYLLQRKNF